MRRPSELVGDRGGPGACSRSSGLVLAYRRGAKKHLHVAPPCPAASSVIRKPQPREWLGLSACGRRSAFHTANL